jgi:hypothetical protein
VRARALGPGRSPIEGVESGARDKWILRRLRLCQWKQWKRTRTRVRELRALGLQDGQARKRAFSRKAYWRIAGGPLHHAMPRTYWKARGVVGLVQMYQSYV